MHISKPRMWKHISSKRRYNSMHCGQWLLTQSTWSHQNAAEMNVPSSPTARVPPPSPNGAGDGVGQVVKHLTNTWGAQAPFAKKHSLIGNTHGVIMVSGCGQSHDYHVLCGHAVFSRQWQQALWCLGWWDWEGEFCPCVCMYVCMKTVCHLFE